MDADNNSLRMKAKQQARTPNNTRKQRVNLEDYGVTFEQYKSELERSII